MLAGDVVEKRHVRKARAILLSSRIARRRGKSISEQVDRNYEMARRIDGLTGSEEVFVS